jgi:hypothetical protein
MNDGTQQTTSYDFQQVETALGVIPGNPTVVFFDASTQVAVAICPAPVLAVDESIPFALTYKATVMGDLGSYVESEMSNFIQTAMLKFDLRILAESVGNKEIEVIIKMADIECNADGVHILPAIILVAVKPEEYLKIVQLRRAELDAALAMLPTHPTKQ